MRQLLYNIFLATLISIILANCANRGTPQGGEKDTTPPEIIKSEPENFTTNFRAKEIIIEFDEYIKINNIQKNLIISPPMDPMPEITPLGSASKKITIKIHDTLQANTTYALNFGESIVDNNESNPYPFYRYVFSTGEYIDSLKLGGSVKNALERKTDEFVTIMLYEVDSTFSDSVIYRNKPKYITNTLDSTNTYQLQNLKEGKYLMVALKDENSNYTFEPSEDKIGFLNEFVTLPTDESYEFNLFAEEPAFKVLRGKLKSGNKLAFGVEGIRENIKIKMLSDIPENFEDRTMRDLKSDSLLYFYKPNFKQDSLVFSVSNGVKQDSVIIKIRDLEKDSLIVRASPSRSILFYEDFKLEGNIPFTKLDRSKISFINGDSLNVDYSTKLDSLKNQYLFSFNKDEGESYKVNLYPGAITDFFGNVNDTLSYSLQTSAFNDFGNLRLTIKNATYPIIVQLVDETGNVKMEKYSTQPEVLDFRNIVPANYYIRVVYDSNGNKKYDTGNYLKKIQPERVSYYPNVEDIRAGWDIIVDFTLLD